MTLFMLWPFFYFADEAGQHIRTAEIHCFLQILFKNSRNLYWQAFLQFILFSEILYITTVFRGLFLNPHFFSLFLREETNIEVCVQGRLFFSLQLQPRFFSFALVLPAYMQKNITPFLFGPSRLVGVSLPSQINGIAIIFLGKKPIEKYCEYKFLLYESANDIFFVILH